MYIKYGRHQLRKDLLVGVTFDEAKETFKHIKENIVKECWKIANPKRVKKVQETKGEN